MPVATTLYKGEMLFETQIGDQRILTDVTPPMGGKDRAPTPPDMFVVSIGACIAAFVAHYCEQQGIDTRDMRVETSYEKADRPVFLTDFRVDVMLPHARCTDRREALRRVADRCIIHETLRQLKGLEIHIHDQSELAAAA